MKDYRLLVVVVVYNGIKWLEKCISSVENSSIKADIYIVDNGSTDGSIDFLKNRIPDTRLLISQDNLGFGKANNIGIRYALNNGYDYVYLLNQDAWVETETFERLILISQQYPDYGILSPLQLNEKKTLLDNNFTYCCPNNMVSDYICNNEKSDVYETSFVMAAHWLIPSNVIRIVGGFSPTFPHYGEDNNYIHRLIYWKFRVGIVPSCSGVHDRENRTTSKEKMSHIAEMTWRYLLSNPNSSKSTRLKECLQSILYNLYKIPTYSIKRIYYLVWDYKQIKLNLKKSTNKGAFL